MRSKRTFFTLLLIVTLLVSTTTVNARDKKNNGRFNDVDPDHWAYDYIELMSDLQIINGYGNGNFGPSDVVSREQFAKMMVLTLQLDLSKPSTPFFQDVDKGDWSYSYIETARSYLTGRQIGDMYYFNPQQDAEREDMAVAIVKGMGLSTVGVDESILNQFDDANQISTNLRPYVAKAVEEGIMVGDGSSFAPRDSLKRAEAATLLARLIEGEKVVFDEEKIVIGDLDEDLATEDEMTPELAYEMKDDYIKLYWSKVDDHDFKYYKVIVSKNDSTPSYPDNGRLYVIDDSDETYAKVMAKQKVYEGDVASLQGGESYYFSITAVYENGDKYTSNVKQIVVPEVEEDVIPDSASLTPVLTYDLQTKGIALNWSQTPEENFIYYKVVLSKDDSTPVYPEDGYLTYKTDNSETYYFAEDNMAYNNVEDLKYLASGDSYYVSITAVYKFNNKAYYYPSNSFYFTMP